MITCLCPGCDYVGFVVVVACVSTVPQSFMLVHLFLSAQPHLDIHVSSSVDVQHVTSFSLMVGTGSPVVEAHAHVENPGLIPTMGKVELGFLFHIHI